MEGERRELEDNEREEKMVQQTFFYDDGVEIGLGGGGAGFGKTKRRRSRLPEPRPRDPEVGGGEGLQA